MFSASRVGDVGRDRLDLLVAQLPGVGGHDPQAGANRVGDPVAARLELVEIRSNGSRDVRVRGGLTGWRSGCKSSGFDPFALTGMHRS